MLPLWIACCERFLRIETADYHERVWCRLEMLLSKAYSIADHHVVITPDFVNPWPATGCRHDSRLANPATGKMANSEEIELLRPLVDSAVHIIKRGRAIAPISRWDRAHASSLCTAEELAAGGGSGGDTGYDFTSLAIKSFVL